MMLTLQIYGVLPAAALFLAVYSKMASVLEKKAVRIQLKYNMYKCLHLVLTLAIKHFPVVLRHLHSILCLLLPLRCHRLPQSELYSTVSLHNAVLVGGIRGISDSCLRNI